MNIKKLRCCGNIPKGNSNDRARWLLKQEIGGVFREVRDDNERYLFISGFGAYPIGLPGVCIELSDGKSETEKIAIGREDSVYVEFEDDSIRYESDSGTVFLYPVTEVSELKKAMEEIGEIVEIEQPSEMPHEFKPLDIVKTPKGEIAIIQYIAGSEASIEYITSGDSEEHITAWWDVAKFTYLNNLSDLLVRMMKI